MRVLIVEAGKAPRAAEMEDALSALQEVVGGTVQAVYPFEERVALIVGERRRDAVGAGDVPGTVEHGGHLTDRFGHAHIACDVNHTRITGLADERTGPGG